MKITNLEKRNEALTAFKGGMKMSEVAKKFGVSVGSIRNWTRKGTAKRTAKSFARGTTATTDAIRAIIADPSLSLDKKVALTRTYFN